MRSWYPPFAKNAEDGAPRCLGDASDIKSLGHPPVDASFRGLPPRRRTRPASPSSAYRSFHTYSRLRRIPSSCATARTLSPAATRRTAANFNSIAYSICFEPSRDMRSPLENCHHFPCLSFGVHSTELTPIYLPRVALHTQISR